MAIKLYKSQINVSKQSSTVETAKLSPNFGQQAFQAQQNFLDLTQQIENKYQKIQEDKDVLQTTTEYNENLNEIIDNTNKLNNLEKGMKSYDTASDELYNNLTGKIKNQNVKRRVDAHITTVNSNYRIDVGSNIRKNSLQVFEAGLELHKNSTFNKMLTGNPALKTQLENQIFNGTPDEPSLYDQYTEAGILTPGITRETFNQSLRNEYDVFEATSFIENNVNAFLEKDKLGSYNSLDPETLLKLRAKANSTITSNNNAYKTTLVDNKKIIKQEIKELLDITKGDQFPDTVRLDNVIARASAIHESLIEFPGEVGLRKELLSLQNAVSVISHIAPYRQLSLNNVNEEFNNIQSALKINEGKDSVTYTNAVGQEITMSTQQAIDTRDAFEKLITYRNSNKDNLIKVAIDSGVQYDGQAIPQIDNWAEVTAEELNVRGALGNYIQTMYDADTPQYFTEIDKTSIKNIWNSGNKDDIQKAISSVIFMAGADNAPIAFNQLGDGYEGIAHIGTLQAINNGSTIELDNALDALVQLRTVETQDRFKSFSLAENSVNYVGSKVQALMEDRIGAFVDNTYAQDINLYRQLKNSTQLIAYGMVINNPEFSELRLDADAKPLNDKDVVKMFDTALNIAAGYHNGFGGITSYNDHSLILPEWFPNSKNPEDTDGDLNFVLSKIMTDELFELATSIEVSGNIANLQKNRIVEHVPNELQDNDVSEFIKREIPANEIFGVNELGLYSVEPGKYIMTFGNPRFAQEGYTNSEGQLVVLDLNKIKPYIDAYLADPELAKKQKIDRIKSNISQGGDLF